MLDCVVGQDHPLVFSNHVCKFFLQEVHKFEAGLVGASLDGIVTLLLGPRSGFEDDGNAIRLDVLKELTGRMFHVDEVIKITTPTTTRTKDLPT